ncbi:ribonuclease H-like YkuK family protein [Fuchsiella alkaliacetigena]|uniref:ribonuclease H-like YkuK family protein n=1 Tax=Fuchsiella alkaliacetigena TaxID=957042 RepID=UPI00200AA89D|nr:ribonuclease H-like YkuK family protein [Fuchsiella alkaliacetigena]MCK8824996.1 ribonuclease H-like YkuK family protein [Fuchsiella alkaliacetigena]
MNFISPTEGRLSFEQTFNSIISFVKEFPKDNYRLIIGSDSQQKEKAIFVTAIIIYREGKGARFYYTKERTKRKHTLREKIYHETLKSLEVAKEITEKILMDSISDLNIEIHLDVGQNGDTRDLIKEVVGLVIGNGYEAKIKPLAYAASSVADRYTK